MTDQHHMPRVGWSWNIRFGDLVTISVLLVTIAVWGVRQEGRIDTNTERIRYVEQRIDRERAIDRGELASIRAGVQRVEDKLDRFIERQ